MKKNLPPGLRFAILDRAFKKRMDELAREKGLTSVQLRVLGELSRLEASGVEEVNQRDLERAEHVTHPTMTEIIKRLERNGFVNCVTSQSDHRYKKISCTEKSVNIYRELSSRDSLVFQELCAGLPPEDIDSLLRITDRILDNIADERWAVK